MEATVFYNLISVEISHDFCHILFVGMESVSPAHTQEDRITQGCGYQEAGGHQRGIDFETFETAYPSFHTVVLQQTPLYREKAMYVCAYIRVRPPHIYAIC